MDPVLEEHARTVLAVLRRAQQVFGLDAAPAEPPDFAAPADLERDLGRAPS